MTSLAQELDAGTREVLDRYGFDAERFEALRERVRSGELTPEANVVRGTVEPPRPEDLVRLPEPGEDAEARAAGEEALRRGELATVVLNGGMATRFGGVVKGTVEVLDGRSFLELKLGSTADVAEALERPRPADRPENVAVTGSVEGGAPVVAAEERAVRLEPERHVLREE
ncbi:MAG TPA: hypothetical protein VNT23_04760, partial [Gaiellaceae bacterium]|nr:hypothetical protein [Gaiellaceae bacterium]